MSNYRVINDNGYERTWEELYEDNVRFQKYTDKLEQENQKYKEVINKLNFIKNRKNQGASQENINKMAIEFVNSYLKEVE